MKKLQKINLTLDKEVISSLSGNEMNIAKGGTIVVPPYSYNINNCDPQPVTINGITCVINLCVPQTINNCPTNGKDVCYLPVTEGGGNSCNICRETDDCPGFTDNSCIIGTC